MGLTSMYAEVEVILTTEEGGELGVLSGAIGSVMPNRILIIDGE